MAGSHAFTTGQPAMARGSITSSGCEPLEHTSDGCGLLISVREAWQGGLGVRIPTGGDEKETGSR